MPHCNKQMISFFLTTRCNLCCSYCYNAGERSSITEQTLSFDIAKAGIDWYFKNNSSRHVRFYGPGEPTQEFELMKGIVDYAREVGGKIVSTEIQTNGIFDEKTRDWCLNNFNIMWMSFDGLPKIQNKYRPLNPKHKANFGGRTSADVIEDNVRWLISNSAGQKLMVGARVTMTNDNNKQQKEMVDYFHSLGIKYVWTNPLFQSVGHITVKDDPEKIKRYDFDMNTYLDYYVEAYKYAKTKGVFWGSFLMINFDGDTVHHCRACTPTPHLTPDGYLSACDMVLLGKEPAHMGCFIYGKWNEITREFDLYDNKIAALRTRQPDNISHCKTCEAKYRCAGYCLGEVVNETGKLDGRKPINCAAVKRLFKELGKQEPFDFLHP